MDTYHGSHGDGLGFEFGVGLSLPRVLLSSPDGVPDEDTFLRHSFLVAGFILIAFASDPKILCEGFIILHSCSYAL
jgi:hypothetical protein